MIKLIACVLYLNGLGFRRIGAILSEGMPSPKVQRTPLEDALGMAKVNHNSVIRSEGMPLAWVKEYGKEIEKIFPIDKTKRHCKVIEIDEMWHYVEKKNKNCGFGLLLPQASLRGEPRNKRSASLANGIKRKKDTQEITYTNLSYFL